MRSPQFRAMEELGSGMYQLIVDAWLSMPATANAQTIRNRFQSTVGEHTFRAGWLHIDWVILRHLHQINGSDRNARGVNSKVPGMKREFGRANNSKQAASGPDAGV